MPKEAAQHGVNPPAMPSSSNLQYNTPSIFILTGDPLRLERIQQQLRSAKIDIRLVAISSLTLTASLADATGCVIVDTGDLRIHESIFVLLKCSSIPVILIADKPDIRSCVEAVKAGAFDFLDMSAHCRLADSVSKALLADSHQQAARFALATMQHRFSALSQRERQVFSRVVSGAKNKQTAANLGISEITVKLHRASITRKLSSKSLIDLARIAQMLDIAPVNCS